MWLGDVTRMLARPLGNVSKWRGWWVPERNLSGVRDTRTSVVRDTRTSVVRDTRARGGTCPPGSVTSSSTLRNVPAVLGMTRGAGCPRTNAAPENLPRCQLDLPSQAAPPLVKQTLGQRRRRIGQPGRRWAKSWGHRSYVSGLLPRPGVRDHRPGRKDVPGHRHSPGQRHGL
jgi:hypothetical protein